MKLASTIERRLLVNWRADPDLVQRLLPSQLRPTLVADSAVVGVCLVRLSNARPRGAPMPGLTSEGAAHRVGVEWDAHDGLRKGVYIWRRHTNSNINRLLGGRFFPGAHDYGRFTVSHTNPRLAISVNEIVDVEVDVDRPFTSAIFRDRYEASASFENAPVGISPRRRGGLEAMRLATDRWAIQPVGLTRARSHFYDDPNRFPPGTIEPDCALLMQNVPAIWTREDAPC